MKISKSDLLQIEAFLDLIEDAMSEVDEDIEVCYLKVRDLVHERLKHD